MDIVYKKFQTNWCDDKFAFFTATFFPHMWGCLFFEDLYQRLCREKGRGQIPPHNPQSFSLEPEGLKKLIRNLNRIPSMLGSDTKKVLENEKAPIKKMAKSIVAAKEIDKDSSEYKDWYGNMMADKLAYQASSSL